MDTWRNGCFGKMDDKEDNTTPPPSQNGCSLKKILQIILAAKWRLRHSSTSSMASASPKQHRRPLPSLLYKSLYTNYTYLSRTETKRRGSDNLQSELERRRKKVLWIRISFKSGSPFRDNKYYSDPSSNGGHRTVYHNPRAKPLFRPRVCLSG